MVTYNSLDKDLREKLNDLTSDEVQSILDSIIKNLYAYDVFDLDNMHKYKEELDQTQKILESRFTNIRLYSTRRQVFYEASISHLRLRKLLYKGFRGDVMMYIQLFGQLESTFFNLIDVLDIYFWNYSNYSFLTDLFGDLALKEHLPITFPINDRYVFGVYETNNLLMTMLDDLIRDMRDNILETINQIDEKYCNSNSTPDELDEMISDYRNHVHEIIEDDYYRYEKEKGVVEIELGFIPLHKIYYDLNQEYLRLKNEIEELFEGDNGFKRIYPFFPFLFFREESRWRC